MPNKKFNLASGVLFSSVLLLGACGNDEQVTEQVTDSTANDDLSENNDDTDDTDDTDPDPEDPDSTEDNSNTDTEDANPGGGLSQENVGGEVFGFTDFELDVDYPEEDDALQISYEEDRDKVEAEYENTLTDEDLTGNDAFDVISPLLAQLELTAEMSDEEVINKVIEVFEIESDYESIEIEVTYPDGTDKDYEDSRD